MTYYSYTDSELKRLLDSYKNKIYYYTESGVGGNINKMNNHLMWLNKLGLRETWTLYINSYPILKRNNYSIAVKKLRDGALLHFNYIGDNDLLKVLGLLDTWFIKIGCTRDLDKYLRNIDQL